MKHVHYSSLRKALLQPSSYQTVHRKLTDDSYRFTLAWGAHQAAQRKIHYIAGSVGSFSSESSLDGYIPLFPAEFGQ